MDIIITEEKYFSVQDIQKLFLSVGWVSGKFPTRLHKALINSSTVFTAWDNDKLVGLARILDDSELLAYIHYVLVNPAYHGKGIASSLMKKVIEKYKDYLYIEGMPEESRNVLFYEKFGFQKMKDGAAIQRCNFSNQW